MSNQFYNFISSELLKYLEQSGISPGDRYFLVLNDYDEINKVKESIENNSDYEKNQFIAPNYSFSTINFSLNTSDVIFVFISEEVTHDFLVTVRNRVSNQEGIWKNKSVVFLINEDLDSITGGSFNLSKQGAPFHQDTLKEKIKKLVTENKSSNKLGVVEQAVLSYILDSRFIDNFVRYTLKDFEGIYSIYQNKEITKSDYKNLELFNDKQLNSFTDKKDIVNRLKQNEEIYNDVLLYHSQGEAKEKLKNIFESPGIITQLNSTDWKDTEFNSILKSYEEMKRQKKINISFDKEKFTDQFKNTSNEVLEKPEGQTKAMLRTRNIIINRNNQQMDKIMIPFDTKIDKKNINTNKAYLIKKGLEEDLEFTVRDKNLTIKIPEIDDDISYLNITYRHNNENSLRFTFKILIVNFSLEFIEKHKAQYSLNYNKKDKLPVIKIRDYDSLITFGLNNSEEVVSEDIGETYSLNGSNLDINVKKLINEDASNIYFYLNIYTFLFRIELTTPKMSPVPRSSQYLYRKVYENAQSMNWDGKILIQDTDEYYVHDYFKDYLELEKSMVHTGTFSVSYKDGKITDIPLQLDQDLISAYQDFFKIIMENNTLPSITAFNKNLYAAANNICTIVDSKIKNIEDDSRLDKKTKNISEIGKLYYEDEIIFTILNPFLLRYEIEKYKLLESQSTNEKLINKFNPSNLIPFYIENENSFFSEYDSRYPKSLIFKNYNKHNNVQGENIESIIKSRLTDFQEHFSYLFLSNKKLPIKLKFSNITEYKHILKGVILYILNQAEKAEKHEEDIPPIHLYLDEQTDLDSYINIFNIKALDDLLDTLSFKVSNKLATKYDERDILKIINSKISVFTSNNQEDFHITFYNFNQSPTFAVYNSESLNCSFASNGFISSNSIHTKMYENYVSGFGVKGAETEASTIVDSAKLWNSLFVTNKDNGLHSFQANSTLVNNISDIESQDFNNLFDHSYWVTFIDPAVDLSYFNDSENPLYIIHYSDQTSSLNYESITVTNKIFEYENILSEYLAKVHQSYKPDNIENLIRSFNILNGEWLLKIIGDKKANDNSVREKLSVISAYKNVMSLLDNDKIIWIPISLEEILRVSRLQGINKTSDLFSASELGYKGSTSDDLLFIGLEENNDVTNIHLLPVEVKIGLNTKQVSNKAQLQLTKTFEILKEQLIDDTYHKAKQKFYRFFFLNLYFSNLEKFITNGLVNEEKYIKTLSKKSKVLNSDNIFTHKLNKQYYSGISVLFTTSNIIRKFHEIPNEPILELQLNEQDGYTDTGKSYEEVLREWKDDIRGLDQSYFLSNRINKLNDTKDDFISDDDLEDTPLLIDKTDESDEVVRDIPPVIDNLDESDEKVQDNPPIVDEPDESDEKVQDNPPIVDEPDGSDEIVQDNTPIVDEPDESDKKVQDSSPVNDKVIKSNLVTPDIKLLLGTVKGSNTKLFWEYGSNELANRHLLITGKSGQGKTYFMQTLLYEMSKNNLDSFIIDYTDSFLQSQIEDNLIKKIGDKIKHRYIIQDKLPLNPFKKEQVELDREAKKFRLEEDLEVAERIVEILDFVFNLGIQQNYKLKEIILEGLAIYNDNLTFTIIKKRLKENEEHTLLGRLSYLLDRDPFDYSTSDADWSNYFSGNGHINIFQLKGYPTTIQQVITEFLLWDIFNYSTRSGNKNITIPILLDEMQNLNHKSESPTGKILREGRKFGWSAWLATQALSSIQSGGSDLSYIFNAGLQIHFAAPENQIKTISSHLSTDRDERRELEYTLSNLSKGECLVRGYSNINDEFVRTTEIVKITSLEDRD